MKDSKPNPANRPHDPGFQRLNSAEQAYARLFYVAKSKGELEVQLGSKSKAIQMRMRLYTFRRWCRGESEKKPELFPYLSVVMEDLTMTVEPDGRLIIRDHVESPGLKSLIEAAEDALGELEGEGIDVFAPDERVEARKQQDSGSQSPDNGGAAAPTTFPEPIPEASESQKRFMEKLQAEAPELYADNPYYSRNS